ncbi:type IV toxin-antitoxin system AbiEi family antitoxin domain-containing protein [Neomicrococcus aestuarii]|uniref:AbiEi antitoxin N-terminal domain-containing protein n=1 Tax=Neomicrococcus aestuarii TaxID=556325 RepID=A0A1L2ZNJ8_9MICC|nr:type IV toxin-antitoxin system AbiEi family antitoxin domain-containing protein [Neomicrococcus aestuarii]APF40719.1 hypothetical protein BHE16_06495 [Neomicrococcus aestuarii]
MNTNEALRVLAEVTVSQWGMLTTAQANARGISRVLLSRLAKAGHLVRLSHGVYRDAGVPIDRFEDLRAAWLSTEPKKLAEDRMKNLAHGVVVGGTSAAQLHGIGDLWAERHEFVARDRKQSQRTEIRYRRRLLEDQDVTLVEGIPVMRIERTLADLLEETRELSLVADALRDAVKVQQLDVARMTALLGPLAERNGFRRHDGKSLLGRLLEIAGLDVDSKAMRISQDIALTEKVIQHYQTMKSSSGREQSGSVPIIDFSQAWSPSAHSWGIYNYLTPVSTGTRTS